MGCGSSTPADQAGKAIKEEAKKAESAVVGGADKAAAGAKQQGEGVLGEVKKLAEETAEAVKKEVVEGEETRNAPVTCRVFAGDSGKGTLPFPELGSGAYALLALQAKPDFGVCMSGGGMRAASCSVGVIRALHSMGVLSKARYLSTTSGASWLNSPLSFSAECGSPAHASLDEFLGPYFPPEQLTPKVLKEVGGFMGALSNSKAMEHYAGDVLLDFADMGWWKNKAGAWTKAIAEVFLEPFGLGNLRTSTATALGTQGTVHERILASAKKMGLTVYSYDGSAASGLPFPIITECVLRPNDSRIFFPAEWTPLYAGVPVALTDEQGTAFGGGWVEPIGQNSTVTKKPEGAIGPDGVDVELVSVGPATLGEATSISSQYIPYTLALGKNLVAQAENLLLGGVENQYWSQQDFEAKPTEWADGGGCDYSAIAPLLRRKVKKILCWLSTQVSPTSEAAFSAGDGVALMFGRYPGTSEDKPDAATQNKLQQVFPSAAYDALYADASARFAAGGPVYHRATLPVSQNDFLGIQTGWEVDVLFVWNCDCANFTSALPSDTKDLISAQKSSHLEKCKESAVLAPFVATDLATFPYVSTSAMNYAPELTVALSNLSAWAIHGVAAEVNSMLA